MYSRTICRFPEYDKMKTKKIAFRKKIVSFDPPLFVCLRKRCGPISSKRVHLLAVSSCIRATWSVSCGFEVMLRSIWAISCSREKQDA